MAMAFYACDNASNLAFDVGKRNKASGEALMANLSVELKKARFTLGPDSDAQD